MTKLTKKYRNTVKHIIGRDWMARREKYWSIDAVAWVCSYDADSPTRDLQILQRLQRVYLGI